MNEHRVARGLFAALVALASTSCTQQMEMETGPYEFQAPDGTTVQAELGHIRVPENRAREDSREISLDFVRLRSTSATPGDPIVYLAGGPGGSGIAELTGPRYPLFHALRSVADVIAFDQRGTGQSGDLPICSIPDEDRPPLSEPLTETRAAEWYSEQAKRCLEFWKARGIDIDGYNTLESVGDLEALRIALGARRLNLWSISYGSHLAMAAIKQMEGRVGRVVMAGAEGPDETVKLPARHEAFLAHVSGLVRDDPDVGARYPDFLGTMHTVLDSVEQHPVIVPVESADGDAIEVAVSRFVLQVITAFQAKNPDGLRTLPALFYAMANGDFGFAASGYLQIHAQFLSGLRAMPLAMDYASGISEERRWLVTEQAQNAAIGNALNFPFPQLFGSLEITDLGPEYRRSVRTDVPTLFLSGTLDGRTFLTAHMETMQGFSRASHIIIENAGHDMFMSHPDLIPLITRFFAGDSIPDTRLHVEPPDFL